MLRAIELENFKAFGKRQRVELAPITLIFGENSAGKSSILQALSLLKQSRRYGDEKTVLIPRIEGGYVDLGSFDEMIFDHDQGNVLRLRLDFDQRSFGDTSESNLGSSNRGEDTATKVAETVARDFDDTKPMLGKNLCGVELRFSRRSSHSTIELLDWSLHETSESGWRKLVTFSPLGKSGSVSSKHPSNRTEADRFRLGECTWAIDDSEFWKQVLTSLRARIESIRQKKSEDRVSVGSQRLLAKMRESEKRLRELTMHIATLDTELERIDGKLNDLSYLVEQQKHINSAELPTLQELRDELQSELQQLRSRIRNLELESAHLEAALAEAEISEDQRADLTIALNSRKGELELLKKTERQSRLRLVETEATLRSVLEANSQELVDVDREMLAKKRESVLDRRNTLSVEIEDCVWLLQKTEREYAALRQSEDEDLASASDVFVGNSAAFSELGDGDISAFATESIERHKGELVSFRGIAIVGRERKITIRGASLEPFGGDLLTKSVKASDELQSLLRLLCPMGPFRRLPERWYVASGQSSDNVGYGGGRVAEFLYSNKDLVHRTNDWLKRLEVGYEIKPRRIGVRPQDLFELRLVDERRSKRTEVAIADVGYGISQILPFIVQSLVSDNQIITIEQPEVHIHPRLQADIGDLLAEASSSPHNNQFIVETHSEHLVLRLQSLVRRGLLSPDSVSIIYVSRGEHGATAQRLRLDSDGDFIDEWPGGFFPERAREFC